MEKYNLTDQNLTTLLINSKVEKQEVLCDDKRGWKAFRNCQV